MTRMQLVLLLLLHLGPSERHAAFDQKITEELRASNPDALELWQQANDAREKRDWAGCSRLFESVHAAAPTFWHAVRRQCGCELSGGHRDRAEELCEQASLKDPSAENLGLWATVLAESPDPSKVRRAQSVIARAVSISPDDDAIQNYACQIAIAAQDADALRKCVTALQQVAPDELPTATFAATLAIADKRYAEARDQIERARMLGLPEEEYRKRIAAIDKAQTEKHLGIGVLGIGLVVVLLILGLALPRLRNRIAPAGAK